MGRDRDEGHRTNFPGMFPMYWHVYKTAVIPLCVTVSSFGIEIGMIYHWMGLHGCKMDWCSPCFSPTPTHCETAIRETQTAFAPVSTSLTVTISFLTPPLLHLFSYTTSPPTQNVSFTFGYFKLTFTPFYSLLTSLLSCCKRTLPDDVKVQKWTG